MAELKGDNKKSVLMLKTLSFFSSSNDQSKSPKKFGEQNGVVGLGIVAALTNESSGHGNTHNRLFSVSPRSNPIPIFSKQMKNICKDGEVDGVEIELCEEYTCVISHVGNNLIKKREYFDDGIKTKISISSGGGGGGTTSYWLSANCGGGEGGIFCAPSPTVSVAGAGGRVFEHGDFLSACYLCKKKLHGLDIFMYRGEKAFCSEECRYKQISIDEHKEKYVSGVRKQPECTASPCSGPMQCVTEVAAA